MNRLHREYLEMMRRPEARPCGDCIVYRSMGIKDCEKCVIDLTEEDCTPPGHGEVSE